MEHDRTDTESRASRITGEHVWALGLFFLALVCGRTVYSDELSSWGDNAELIVLAKSIAAGQGLREINRPDRPVHRKYPPGWPLMLAAIERVRPDGLGTMKHLVLGMFVLSVVLTYWLIAAWGRPRLAIVVAVLLCTNRVVLHFSHVVMAEVPYLFFSLLALMLYSRHERRGGPWSLVGLFLVVAWAALIKSSGVALAGGLCLAFVLRRRWVRGGLLVGAAAVAWGVAQLVRGLAQQPEYLGQLVAVDPYDPARGLLTWWQLLVRVGANLKRYSFTVLPEAVAPVEGTWALSVLILILLIAGLGLWLRRGHVSALHFLCYVALLLAWPREWAVHRMVLPLLPLCVFFVSEAVVWIAVRAARRVPPLVGKVGAVAVVGLVASTNLVEAIRFDPGLDPRWRSYRDALVWIRDQSPHDSVVLCRKPYLGYLLARRQTVGVPHTRERDLFHKEMSRLGVDVVVVDRLALPGTWQYLVPRIKEDPVRFRLVHRTSGPFAALVFGYRLVDGHR